MNKQALKAAFIGTAIGSLAQVIILSLVQIVFPM